MSLIRSCWFATILLFSITTVCSSFKSIYHIENESINQTYWELIHQSIQSTNVELYMFQSTSNGSATSLSGDITSVASNTPMNWIFTTNNVQPGTIFSFNTINQSINASVYWMKDYEGFGFKGIPFIIRMSMMDSGSIALCERTNNGVILINQSTGDWITSWKAASPNPYFDCAFDPIHRQALVLTQTTSSITRLRLIKLDTTTVITNAITSIGSIAYNSVSNTWLLSSLESQLDSNHPFVTIFEYDSLGLYLIRSFNAPLPIGLSHITDLVVDASGTILAVLNHQQVYALYDTNVFDPVQCVTCWNPIVGEYRWPMLDANGDLVLPLITSASPTWWPALQTYSIQLTQLPDLIQPRCSGRPFNIYHKAHSVNLPNLNDQHPITMSISSDPLTPRLMFWSPSLNQEYHMFDINLGIDLRVVRYTLDTPYRYPIHSINSSVAVFYHSQGMCIFDDTNDSPRILSPPTNVMWSEETDIDLTNDRAVWMYVAGPSYPKIETFQLSDNTEINFNWPRIEHSVLSIKFHSKSKRIFVLVDSSYRSGSATLFEFNDDSNLTLARTLHLYDCVMDITDMLVDSVNDQLVLITKSSGTCFFSLDGTDTLTCQAELQVQTSSDGSPLHISSVGQNGDLFVVTFDEDSGESFVSRWQLSMPVSSSSSSGSSVSSSASSSSISSSSVLPSSSTGSLYSSSVMTSSFIVTSSSVATSSTSALTGSSSSSISSSAGGTGSGFPTSENGLSSGAIAGISIGMIVLVVIVLIICCYLRPRFITSRLNRNSEVENDLSYSLMQVN